MTSGAAHPTADETVTARFWASARAAVGVDVESIPLPAGGTVADVLSVLTSRHGDRVGAVLSVCSVLLDGLRADPDTRLAPGAELEFLPPFAGG